MEGPKLQIQEELLLAKQSRIEGNEGRARVCARRAAGAAVQTHLQRTGLSPEPGNAMQSIMLFKSIMDLPERVQIALDWLLQRVDEDYNLPPEVDLIQEADIVIRFVEGKEP